MGLRFDEISADGYERVVYAEDASAGLQAIIAIHNTHRGPACGGIRLLPYASRADALEDVLRLSKGMSYKSSLAGIGFGGGKSVIIADPQSKNAALFDAFGDFVESFQGRYIAAKDMNINSQDLIQVKTRTRHVLGIDGEIGSGGDPSPVTALGLFRALEATWLHLRGTRDLRGVRVAVQGAGHVGLAFVKRVRDAGGEVAIADINPESMKAALAIPGVRPVDVSTILSMECDVLAPCARGAILNESTIPQLRCKAVVGCANNQLATEKDGYRLHERGILYAPDYAVNSGGIINIFAEHAGFSPQRALEMTDNIFQTLTEIYSRARTARVPAFVTADKLAEERLHD